MTPVPVLCITGDIHFNLQTLELASSSLRQLLAKARELNIPAVINGDLNDTKAIVRAEVANRLIEILEPEDPTRVFINTGNHDLINQKATASSLNFLRPYAQVIGVPTYVDAIKSWIVPYFSENADLQTFLNAVPDGSRLIVHQGLIGADMGSYVKDSSSLAPEAFANFRTVASHFHRRQQIQCGKLRKGGVGTFTYCGSPYTISFSESGDGPKGINVLYDDGSLELVPTGLRKHVIIEMNSTELNYELGVDPKDLLWIKVKGPTSDLAKLKKSDVAVIVGHSNFKLDKIYTDAPVLEEKAAEMTEAQVMDALIDAGSESDAKKSALKSLWRELVCA